MAQTFCIDASLAGLRADKALACLVPQLGLRGSRRLIGQGLLLCNGKCARPVQRLREGDELLLAGQDACMPQALSEQARCVAHIGPYAFLEKPAGLHTLAVTGGGPSLEGLVPQLLPECGQAWQLLQRLDMGTSGLVAATADNQAASGFVRLGEAGKCEKRYLAILAHALAGPRTVQQGLDTSHRKISRIVGPTDDSTRWSRFTPLHVWTEQESPAILARLGLPAAQCGQPCALALAGVVIRRGARHQIRAHAAWLGHPLWGDPLYADAASGKAAGRFFLHHAALRLPDVACTSLPAWPLDPEVMAVADSWLNGTQ